MLDTDQAWEVFDKLEAAYFEPGAQLAAPKALPPPPQAVVHLPGEQYAVITEGLGRVMDLFHPHSQPFINLLGVKRALAGISPQGFREPRFVIVAPGDSALSQPSGAPEGARGPFSQPKSRRLGAH